ncbi:MAG: hypothetical protein LBS01_06145 [Prevotellaceae bacterium]|jgi:hypothetical protein|nr:hypothetical protein [Prevotellaceae bacterium]
MATIYKVEDIFKPLNEEQKRFVIAKRKKIGSLKGKIKLKSGDIFNLKES